MKKVLSLIICFSMLASYIGVCFADDSLIEMMIESEIELLVGDDEDVEEFVIEENTETAEVETNADGSETVNADTAATADTEIEAEADTGEVTAEDVLDAVDAVPTEEAPAETEDTDPAEKEEDAGKEMSGDGLIVVPVDIGSEDAVKPSDKPEEEVSKDDAEKEKTGSEDENKHELDVETLLISTSVANNVYTLRDQVYFYNLRDYVYTYHSYIAADIVRCEQGKTVDVNVLISKEYLNYVSFDLYYESDFITLTDYSFGNIQWSTKSLTTESDHVSFKANSVNNITVEGMLVTLTFDVPQDCPVGMFELSFDNSGVREKNYGAFPINLYNGGVSVVPQLTDVGIDNYYSSSTKWFFDLKAESLPEASVIYIGIYDSNGTLLNIRRIEYTDPGDLEHIGVKKTEKDSYAKVLAWDEEMNPVSYVAEMDL